MCLENRNKVGRMFLAHLASVYVYSLFVLIKRKQVFMKLLFGSSSWVYVCSFFFCVCTKQVALTDSVGDLNLKYRDCMIVSKMGFPSMKKLGVALCFTQTTRKIDVNT